MDFNKLSKWLTLVANIAVVVGIFALIAELNHSSRLAEIAAYQGRATEIQEAQVQYALSPDLSKLVLTFNSGGPDALSEAELDRVRAWNRAIIRRMQAQYYQYQQGFLERSLIEGNLDRIASFQYARWAQLGVLGVIDIPEWRAEIEQRIASDGEIQ